MWKLIVFFEPRIWNSVMFSGRSNSCFLFLRFFNDDSVSKTSKMKICKVVVQYLNFFFSKKRNVLAFKALLCGSGPPLPTFLVTSVHLTRDRLKCCRWKLSLTVGFSLLTVGKNKQKPTKQEITSISSPTVTLLTDLPSEWRSKTLFLSSVYIFKRFDKKIKETIPFLCACSVIFFRLRFTVPWCMYHNDRRVS